MYATQEIPKFPGKVLEFEDSLLYTGPELYSEHYMVALRHFPDGTITAVERMLYTDRLCIAYPGTTWGTWDDGWCFDRGVAGIALLEWDPRKSPEPERWTRNPRSGRRRPGGDASQEYVWA